MIDALLILAVLCACFGAFSRGEDGRITINVTALALLASVATTSVFVWIEVPFNLAVWLLIDNAVITVIAFGRRTKADWAIIALFPAAWAFYFTPYSHEATTLIVCGQLLLTFPARKSGQVLRRLVARWKANFRYRDEWTDLERRGQREANV